VPNSTKPMSCLNVSIHAPGFGKNRTSAGNAPINKYGEAIPKPIEEKTTYVTSGDCVRV